MIRKEDIRKRLIGSCLLSDTQKEEPSSLDRGSRCLVGAPAKMGDPPPSKRPLLLSNHVNTSRLREEYSDLDQAAPPLSLKERQERASELSRYLLVTPEESRPMPGYPTSLTPSERVRAGADCDAVFPGILLGNGATLKRVAYLRGLGVTAVLNAAEFRGVNVGEDYLREAGMGKDGGEFRYMGLRVEDTPQTQICR